MQTEKGPLQPALRPAAEVEHQPPSLQRKAAAKAPCLSSRALPPQRSNAHRLRLGEAAHTVWNIKMNKAIGSPPSLLLTSPAKATNSSEIPSKL